MQQRNEGGGRRCNCSCRWETRRRRRKGEVKKGACNGHIDPLKASRPDRRRTETFLSSTHFALALMGGGLWGGWKKTSHHSFGMFSPVLWEIRAAVVTERFQGEAHSLVVVVVGLLACGRCHICGMCVVDSRTHFNLPLPLLLLPIYGERKNRR